MKDIHLGKIVPYANGSYRKLDSIRYIFVCPLCEYRWTSETVEGIKTVRNTHNYCTHPEEHIPTMVQDAKSVLDTELEALRQRLILSERTTAPVGYFQRHSDESDRAADRYEKTFTSL